MFFDEINSPLEHKTTYSSFLAPLEEGIYVRGEKAFHIAPCVWLFAGTGIEPTDPKAEDFQSRLTRSALSLAAARDDPEGETARLERVYLGAALLKHAFQEIETVSEDVLDVFRRLPGEFSNRKVATLAKSFENVRHRTVSAENIPWRWILRNVEYRSRRNFPRREWQERWETGTRKIRVVDQQT